MAQKVKRSPLLIFVSFFLDSGNPPRARHRQRKINKAAAVLLLQKRRRFLKRNIHAHFTIHTFFLVAIVWKSKEMAGDKNILRCSWFYFFLVLRWTPFRYGDDHSRGNVAYSLIATTHSLGNHQRHAVAAAQRVSLHEILACKNALRKERKKIRVRTYLACKDIHVDFPLGFQRN